MQQLNDLYYNQSYNQEDFSLSNIDKFIIKLTDQGQGYGFSKEVSDIYNYKIKTMSIKDWIIDYEIRNFINIISNSGEWKIKRNNDYLRQYESDNPHIQGESTETDYNKNEYLYPITKHCDFTLIIPKSSNENIDTSNWPSDIEYYRSHALLGKTNIINLTATEFDELEDKITYNYPLAWMDPMMRGPPPNMNDLVKNAISKIYVGLFDIEDTKIPNN